MTSSARATAPVVRLLQLFASVVLVATVVCLAAATRAHADSVASCPMTAQTASDQGQSACWRPFSSSSPFNTQLPSNPALASNNNAVVQHMSNYGWSMDGSNSSFSITSQGTRPVYFASPSDPTVHINCTSAEGPGTCQGPNGHSINGDTINLPAGAKPDSNWDGHMTVIETATGQEYDLWHATLSGNTLTSATGAMITMGSNGLGGGGNAAGFALTAGLLRPSELASGHINHALVLTVPCTNATGANTGYTWPASGGWGEHCGQYWNENAGDAPMLGQLLRLNMSDTQIANSGAPAWQQTIMTALSHYGAYIEDTNGSWHDEGMYILSQDPISWTDLGQNNQWTNAISQLGGHGSNLTSNTPIPVSKLQVVDTCVTHGTCPNASTGTVGGQPRARIAAHRGHHHGRSRRSTLARGTQAGVSSVRRLAGASR